MSFYPVFLDMKDRRCLLVGTGRLIEEKAQALQEAGAVVVRVEAFTEEAADGCWLIVAASDDPAEMSRMKNYSERHRVPLNVIDQPDYCTFIAPAILRREDLVVAISTSGKCPALAARIREELAGRYGPEYSTLLRLLGELRPAIKARFSSFDERRDFYYRLLDLDLPARLRASGEQGLKETARQLL